MVLLMVLAMALQGKRDASHAEAAAALSFALDHPALSSSPQVLCAAARACKAWTEAVQQCGVCHTHVVLGLRSAFPHFESFSSWLRTHASLVESIQLIAKPEEEQDGGHVQGRLSEEHLKAALLLLQEALEAAAPGPLAAALATTTPTAAGTAKAAAAGAKPAAASATISAACDDQQHQQLQSPGLHLASFSCDVPAGVGLLAALPAHSLTHLDLHLENSSSSNSAELSAALARLINLQQLQLYSSYVTRTFSGRLHGECLGGLAQLTQLTSLKLGGYWTAVEQPLQQLLQALPPSMRQLQLDFGQDQLLGSCNFNLTHLTALTEFTAPEWSSSPALQLPTQLQVLQLGCLYAVTGSDSAALSRLQQLRRLSCAPYDDQKPLLHLSQLPALQQLALTYEGADEAVATAPKKIKAGAAAATSLTKLQLTGVSCFHDEIGHYHSDSDEDEDHHHHHHVTQSSHSINAIGPAPLWSGG
jgi:hypothetical protein